MKRYDYVYLDDCGNVIDKPYYKENLNGEVVLYKDIIKAKVIYYSEIFNSILDELGYDYVRKYFDVNFEAEIGGYRKAKKSK